MTTGHKLAVKTLLLTVFGPPLIWLALVSPPFLIYTAFFTSPHTAEDMQIVKNVVISPLGHTAVAYSFMLVCFGIAIHIWQNRELFKAD